VKLLLDTHIWIWSLLQPQKLGRRVARELASLRNEIWLSPVSVWEALLLAENGHIRIPEGPHRFFETAVAERSYQQAVFTHEVAFESRRLSLATEDPADRFLAATAKVYGLTLVTSDERLLALKEIDVLSNRAR
jgi:PIN domain nuclease of toxin-antitoxin system